MVSIRRDRNGWIGVSQSGRAVEWVSTRRDRQDPAVGGGGSSVVEPVYRVRPGSLRGVCQRVGAADIVRLHYTVLVRTAQCRGAPSPVPECTTQAPGARLFRYPARRL